MKNVIYFMHKGMHKGFVLNALWRMYIHIQTACSIEVTFIDVYDVVHGMASVATNEDSFDWSCIRSLNEQVCLRLDEGLRMKKELTIWFFELRYD